MAQNKTNAFEADILKLIFNGTTIANIAANATTSPATTLSIALFTASPTESGSVANEATYTGYARKTVTRNSTEWPVTASTESTGGITGAVESGGGGTGIGNAGAKVTNANAITFDQCTAGSNVITHMAICKADVEGVADILYAGALQSNLTVSSGVTPQFAAQAITLYEY